MRTLLGIFFTVFSLPLLASTTVTTQIHDIDNGAQMGDETLVFLSSGQVAKLMAPETELMDRLHQAKEEGSWLKVTLNDEREILDLEKAEALLDPNRAATEMKMFEGDYVPSVIGSMDQARRIFRDALHSPRDSQCFNRAHIWSYEWFRDHKVFSSKAWVFFTRKYVRKYNFEWWFHVAPMFHIVDDGKVRQRVVDVKYSRGPLKLGQWTNIFMRNNAECPIVSTYSEHANYPETGWCYLMTSSMYYYQPIDLELLEKFGTPRSGWVEQEIRQAYQEAF